MPLLRHFAVIASGPFNVEWVGFCFGRLMRPIGSQCG
jgi:hypothetical protein